MREKTFFVSVCMITFNHEKFIREAIESVIRQKTNFDIEIVIGEDCSTDNTRKICQDYKTIYSDKIKLLLPKINLGASANFIATLQTCAGKYISICEGDDYFTDPYKLQKQVDFLEANQEYGMVHTDIVVVDKKNQVIYDKGSSKPSGYVFKDLMENAFIVTCSVCARGDLIRALAERAVKENLWYVMDCWFWVHISMVSKIHYIPEVMSAYRSHEGGISRNRNNFFEKRLPLISLDIINERLRKKESNGFRLSLTLSTTYFSTLLARHVPFKQKIKFLPLMVKRPWLFYGLFYVIIRKIIRISRSCKEKIFKISS